VNLGECAGEARHFILPLGYLDSGTLIPAGRRDRLCKPLQPPGQMQRADGSKQ
jgi:hypothetical protein